MLSCRLAPVSTLSDYQVQLTMPGKARRRQQLHGLADRWKENVTTPTRCSSISSPCTVLTLFLSFPRSFGPKADAYTCYNLGQTTWRQNTIYQTTRRVHTAGRQRAEAGYLDNEGYSYESHSQCATLTLTADVEASLTTFVSCFTKIPSVQWREWH